MKKTLMAVLALYSSMAMAHEAKPITVAIVAPAEIPAMDQIVQGYEDQLSSIYDGKITYVVKNAQGDINIQRAIIQQFKNSDADIVAPIATQPAQMAMSMIHDKPIVAMAAEIDNDSKPANMTGVLDEISVAKQIDFVHAVNPDIKKITLVYSASDKVFPEVKEAEKTAAKSGIQVQKLMMQQLSDLYTISKQVADDSNAIFIFKDAQIVSGVTTLVNQAKAKGIPVIASDDGSVASGAAFALGVSEAQIGSDSADLTLKVLNGTSPKDLPIYVMQDYIVFINPKAAEEQGVDVDDVRKAAADAGYQTEDM